jgi:FixJ family two-component response regulator
MSEECATLAVIDRGGAMRPVLKVLHTVADIKVTLFRSTDDFLRSGPHPYNCIVVDPTDDDGLASLAELSGLNAATPIVFVTANPDVRMAVRAMKAGAMGYLSTPFARDELLGAVRDGIERDRERRKSREQLATVRACLASLTNRELEILTLLSAGCEVKEIAGIVGVCACTARVHRSRVMAKIGARSIADVVRLTDRIGLRVCPRTSSGITEFSQHEAD